MKASELVAELNRRVSEGSSFTDKILCARAADLIEVQAKAIEEMREALTRVIDRIDEEFIHGAPNLENERALSSHSKEGEQG